MEEVHQVPSGKEEGRYIHVFPVEVSEDLPILKEPSPSVVAVLDASWAPGEDRRSIRGSVSVLQKLLC